MHAYFFFVKWYWELNTGSHTHTRQTLHHFYLISLGEGQDLTVLVFTLLPLANLDPCNPPASAHNSCVSGIAGVFVDCMSSQSPYT